MAAPVASPARLLAKPPPAATGAAATRRRNPRAVATMIPRATATTTESTKRPVVKTVSIGATFAALKKRGQCAFIPFICAGDPNLDATERAIAILDDEGADVIELGVPYSDPLADGPTIAQAATRALNAGTTLDKTLALLARVTPTTKAPIVLFTYFNPIYQRGFEAFVEAVAKAGAKGLLVPDIPLEETPELSAICAKNGVDLVLLSTPTTPEARMTKIAEASNGFIYLVSVTGVTGVRTNVESRVQELVSGLKKVTDKPVAVGFGISKKEQAAQVVGWGADGVIVGSALVRALGEAPTPEEGLERLTALAKELREGSNREGAKPAGKSGGASFFDRIMGKA